MPSSRRSTVQRSEENTAAIVPRTAGYVPAEPATPVRSDMIESPDRLPGDAGPPRRALYRSTPGTLVTAKVRQSAGRLKANSRSRACRIVPSAGTGSSG